MKAPGWRQSMMLLIFALVVTVTVLFAVRTVRRAIYWRQHHDEVIRPWMTVPYVAHSYRVPPPVLYEALGIPHRPGDLGDRYLGRVDRGHRPHRGREP